MIRYRELVVENYKSIGKAVVEFTPGIFAIQGVTIDGEYSSNGSGKSSVLQAMTIVLFNKDFQGAPIDTVSNRFTGKPFKISLSLFVEKDGVSAEYLIINNRATKRLTTYKDGVINTKATAQSLKVIQDLLGMSEATFKFTHYITTNSILELTANLSNSTLFNEVLQVTQLKLMSAELQDVKKALMKEVDSLRLQYTEFNSVRKLLSVTEKYDVHDLRDQRDALEAELQHIMDLWSERVEPTQRNIDNYKDDLKELYVELRQKKRTTQTGVCPLCNTHLASIDEIHVAIALLENQIDTTEQEVDDMECIIDQQTIAFEMAKAELDSTLSEVSKNLILGQQLEEIHRDTIQGTDGYSEQALKDTHKVLRHKQRVCDYIDKARDAIRTGRIFEDIMTDFFVLVNTNILKYRAVINLTAFDVEAAAYKSGMVVIVKDKGEEIPVESLSNGEKARLSLLVLSALLESIQQTTQSNSNFILFDEATSSFDKSGIEELKDLFAHLKQLEQSCFIITHGDELAKVRFDGVLTVTKEKDVAVSAFVKD